MYTLLVVLVLGLGLYFLKQLSSVSRERRTKILRSFALVAVVGFALLLSLRTNQFWIAALSLVWFFVERYLFRAPSPRADPMSEQRGDAGMPGGGRAGPMSRAEALSVLGLADGATRDEILAAYKKLMKRVHPDTGGSDYLARQLNQAKDVLTS